MGGAEPWVTPVVLCGKWATLEPLAESHAQHMVGLCDATTFRYFSVSPSSFDLPGMTAFVRTMLGMERSVPFAIIDSHTDLPVGMTSFSDIRPQHKGLEIGFTWLTPAARGTSINPQIKHLLLEHAFDQLHANRVQLKTDARNLHSQGAIAKLGATREGVLRKHLVAHDGYVRDTVMYSITREEWPAIRDKLDERLVEHTVRTSSGSGQ